MIVNRIGDFGLAMGLFLIFSTFKTIDYDTLQISASLYNDNALTYIINFPIDTLTLISFFLLVGAVGKSAQIGLHT